MARASQETKSTPSVAEIDELAERLHYGDRRLSGKNYIMHPRAGAAVLRSLGYDAPFIRVELLHDTIEMGKITLEGLRDFGLPDREVSALRALSNNFDGGNDVYLPKYIRSLVDTGEELELTDKLVDLDDNVFEDPFPPRILVQKPRKLVKAHLQKIAICRLAGKVEELFGPEATILEYIRPKISLAHADFFGVGIDEFSLQGPPMDYTFDEMNARFSAIVPDLAA